MTSTARGDRKILSPLEFAATVGVSRQTVYTWIKTGRIKTTQFGRVHLIAPAELSKIRAKTKRGDGDSSR
jgi:excisionase family DNA binding protein